MQKKGLSARCGILSAPMCPVCPVSPPGVFLPVRLKVPRKEKHMQACRVAACRRRAENVRNSPKRESAARPFTEHQHANGHVGFTSHLAHMGFTGGRLLTANSHYTRTNAGLSERLARPAPARTLIIAANGTSTCSWLTFGCTAYAFRVAMGDGQRRRQQR